MSILTNDAYVPEKGKRLALVIVANQAPNSYLPELKHAVPDAEGMADVLLRHCNFELLEPPILGENATSEKVKTAILDLAGDRADEDFLLLYFSGHGLPMLIEAARQDVYLVTYNFRARDVERDENLHFSMRWLRDKLYLPTKAGRVLIILDCCYAGDIGRAAPDPYLEELKKRVNYYFGAPGAESGAQSGGQRLALTATGHNSSAIEQDGHGLLTYWLLPALRGEVDAVIEIESRGSVSLQRLHRYLESTLPPKQYPNVSGDYAGRSCILASYPERATQLLSKLSHASGNERPPRNYIPFPRNALFQPRPGEFEKLEILLFEPGIGQKPLGVGLVGAVGLGGVGKTQLVAELAYRCLDQHRFPSGIYWVPLRETGFFNWVHQLANLALDTEYLPPDDDISSPENEMRRAHHFCHYLANHSDALLILDNVEDSDLLIHGLPMLSVALACSLLYTSRISLPPPGVVTYAVNVLPEDGALRLLLETTRPALLHEILTGSQVTEAIAARAVCQGVGYLPLALVHLRSLLAQDKQVTLVRLAEVLRNRGAFDMAAPLFAAFLLSWEKIRDEGAQRLFKLASFFPEATLVPLWLLGIAAGLGEGVNVFEPLGEACVQLQELSLIERLSDDQIRLHPLVRAFGRRLFDEDSDKGRKVLEEAGDHLTSEFADLNNLEQRTQREGYWRCLEQVLTVKKYLALLGTGHVELLEQAEQRLNREG